MPVNLTADGIYTIGLEIICDLGCALGILAQPIQVHLIILKHELEGLRSLLHVKRTLVAVTQNGSRQVITGNDHETLTAVTVEDIVVIHALHVPANIVETHVGGTRCI